MNQFEYACFISYRNSRHIEGLISNFARELAIALEQYLDAHLIEDIGKTDNDHTVFLDSRIIKYGDFLPATLGQSLSKSLCWIVVFTPNYLSGSLWCASELCTMLVLEKERFQRLNLEALYLCDNWATCSLTDVNTPAGQAAIEDFIQQLHSPVSSTPEMPIA